MIAPASVRAFGVPAVSGSVPPNEADPLLGRRHGRSRALPDPIGVVGSHRCDDLLGRLELRTPGRLLGDGHHSIPRLTDEVPQLVRRCRTELDEAPRVAHQRVTCLDLLDLRDRAIGRLGIAAGVSPQPHRPQVEEDGLARAADVGDGRLDGGPRFVELTVGRDVAEVWHATERGLDPALGRRHADAGAVVLADEQQRHRQPHAHGVARRVDRGEGGGVVRARVAE